MKKGFQKSLALLLAVFMAFGATPFALGFAVFAADPTPTTMTISPKTVSVMVGEEKTLSLSGAYVEEGNPVMVEVANTDVIWASDDSTKVSVSSDGKITGVAVCENIEVMAILKKDTSITATCSVSVSKAPVYVDTISWAWKTTAVLVGATYTLTNDMVTLVPDNADNKEVKFTCDDTSAIQWVEAGKSFKVNPLPAGTAQKTIKITATALGAGKSCLPAVKELIVLSDVPMTSVAWNYAVNATKQTLFKYYEDSSALNKEKNYHPYKFTAYNNGTALDASALSLCTVKVTSDDVRVVRPDAESGKFISVGNGQAKITVSVTTPGGVTKSDSIYVVITDSPYTPITKLGIGYDEKTAGSSAGYDSKSNTISLMYPESITLTAQMNDKAKLDQDAIAVTMDGGRKVKIVSPIDYSWSSSDESIATVDQNGKVTIVGAGTAKITLTVNDNGVEFKKDVNVKGKYSLWAAFVGVIISLFTFNWKKLPPYFVALFEALFGSIGTIVGGLG